MNEQKFKIPTNGGANKGALEVPVQEVEEFDYEKYANDWLQFNHVGVTYDCHVQKNRLVLSFKLNDPIMEDKVLELTFLNPDRPRV